MGLLLVCIATMLLEPTTPHSSPAAWIAVLRDYEQKHGRDVWSYQELCEARTAVLDPYYSAKSPPAWLYTINLLYLRYYPVLFLIVLLGGLSLIWQRITKRNASKTLLFIAGWFLLMWMMLMPIEPRGQTAAVLKSQSMLREGNGASYPLVTREGTPLLLAAGVEAQLLAERSNGWAQLKLTDGTVGWVPTDTVYLAR